MDESKKAALEEKKAQVEKVDAVIEARTSGGPEAIEGSVEPK